MQGGPDGQTTSALTELTLSQRVWLFIEDRQANGTVRGAYAQPDVPEVRIVTTETETAADTDRRALNSLRAAVRKLGEKIDNNAVYWKGATSEPIVAAVNLAWNEHNARIKSIEHLLAKELLLENQGLAPAPPSSATPLRSMLDTIWGDRCKVSDTLRSPLSS